MGQKKQDQTQSEINFSVSDISAIVGMLKENDFFEFCLEKGNDRLWLKRGSEPSSYNFNQIFNQSEDCQSSSQDNVVKLPMQTSAHEVASGPVATVATTTNVQVSDTAATSLPNVFNGVEVKSPMVGTFYRRPAVDAEPYVQVGDVVKKGDVLCIIEAMKIMNEIEADASGKVIEICLNDGQMAEFGEVLFRIEPSA